MNRGLRVSAPGKLILLGEYAVLVGAPAVVMAVNRRAVATVTAASEDDWVVTAPGFTEGAAIFALGSSGDVVWRDRESGKRLALVEGLMAGMAARGLLDPEAAPLRTVDLDTTAFFESWPGERRKLGLGSSAALTVALTSALTGGTTNDSQQSLEWLQTLVALHRGIQGGLGSGIDVAASLYGGVVGYQLDAGGSVVDVTPIEWPDGLFKAFVWTGRSASTGSFLDRLQARRELGATGVDEILERLGEESERGIDALARRDLFRFLDVVDRFWEALAVLGKIIEMPILSDAHCRLRRLAVECDVHYKPSGAGGGDFGVCFCVDEDRLVEFCERAMAAGFGIPDVELEIEGVVVKSM